jgi:hypothetical protein
VPTFPGRYLRQTLVTTAHHANARDSDGTLTGLGENRVNWITETVAGTMQLGTHIDALSHLQIGDRGYNGWRVAELAETWGVNRLGAETIPQIITRRCPRRGEPRDRRCDHDRRYRADAWRAPALTGRRGPVPHRLERTRR